MSGVWHTEIGSVPAYMLAYRYAFWGRKALLAYPRFKIAFGQFE